MKGNFGIDQPTAICNKCNVLICDEKIALEDFNDTNNPSSKSPFFQHARVCRENVKWAKHMNVKFYLPTDLDKDTGVPKCAPGYPDLNCYHAYSLYEPNVLIYKGPEKNFKIFNYPQTPEQEAKCKPFNAAKNHNKLRMAMTRFEYQFQKTNEKTSFGVFVLECKNCNDGKICNDETVSLKHGYTFVKDAFTGTGGTEKAIRIMRNHYTDWHDVKRLAKSNIRSYLKPKSISNIKREYTRKIVVNSKGDSKNIKEFACDHCDKKFSTGLKLIEHESVVHLMHGFKGLFCPVSGCIPAHPKLKGEPRGRFYQIQSLTRHVSKHHSAVEFQTDTYRAQFKATADTINWVEKLENNKTESS